MLTRHDYIAACRKADEFLSGAGIIITERERAAMEVAEYGLGMLDRIGLALIVYVNTARCCAKELVLFPGQTCPEHRHPNVGTEPGKEETFRCRWGEVYLYVPGERTQSPKAKAPEGCGDFFTVWHEIILRPGEQYTLEPDTLHWFQAGPQGAVVSEFSTRSRDGADIYTDPRIDAGLPRRA